MDPGSRDYYDQVCKYLIARLPLEQYQEAMRLISLYGEETAVEAARFYFINATKPKK
jgi:hypothetical protein